MEQNESSGQRGRREAAERGENQRLPRLQMGGYDFDDEVDIPADQRVSGEVEARDDKGQSLPTPRHDCGTSVSEASSLTRSPSRLYYRSSSMALPANKSTS